MYKLAGLKTYLIIISEQILSLEKEKCKIVDEIQSLCEHKNIKTDTEITSSFEYCVDIKRTEKCLDCKKKFYLK